jgi:hypothetical protein
MTASEPGLIVDPGGPVDVGVGGDSSESVAIADVAAAFDRALDDDVRVDFAAFFRGFDDALAGGDFRTFFFAEFVFFADADLLGDVNDLVDFAGEPDDAPPLVGVCRAFTGIALRLASSPGPFCGADLRPTGDFAASAASPPVAVC